VIVYEVRVVLEPAIAAEYRGWLDAHVREILGIEGFRQAELLVEDDAEGRPVLTVRYHIDSREALATYLREHAPRLRAEGTARFGERFSASRRVLELVQVFP
jgi:hypothetical protein